MNFPKRSCLYTSPNTIEETGKESTASPMSFDLRVTIACCLLPLILNAQQRPIAGKLAPETDAIYDHPENGLLADSFWIDAFAKKKIQGMRSGTSKGVVLFHPDSIKSYDYFPPTRITNSALSDQNIELGGMHEQWANLGVSRNLDFSFTLGFYSSIARGTRTEGCFAEEGTSTDMDSPPPFWASNWFRYLLGFATLLSILGIYKYRIKVIEANNRRLEWEVHLRTNELKGSNEQLAAQKQELEIANTELKATFEELKSTRKQLVKQAHQAGMADVATGILHNVGNILNSVNTCAAVLRKTLKNPKYEHMSKANNLLRGNMDDLENFLRCDKGKKLMDYYRLTEESLKGENKEMSEQLDGIERGIQIITEVIQAQQQHAKNAFLTESAPISEIIQQSLILFLQMNDNDVQHLSIENNTSRDAVVLVQKNKMTQIMINLLQNAHEALLEAKTARPKIKIGLEEELDSAVVVVEDNGLGLAARELTEIFNHGYTTKPDGHGFGLHISANYATEMGGKLWAESNGPNQGAIFKLRVPLCKETDS